MDELITSFGCHPTWEVLHNAASALLRKVQPAAHSMAERRRPAALTCLIGAMQGKVKEALGILRCGSEQAADVALLRHNLGTALALLADKPPAPDPPAQSPSRARRRAATPSRRLRPAGGAGSTADSGVGLLEEAREALEVGRSLEPHLAEAHLNEAVVLERQGKLGQAVDSLNMVSRVKAGLVLTMAHCTRAHGVGV